MIHKNSKPNTLKPVSKQHSPNATSPTAKQAHSKHSAKKRGKNQIVLSSLPEMLEMSSNSIALRLVHPRSGLETLLRSGSFTSESIELLVTVFRRAFECHSLRIKFSFLADTIAKSKFFNENLRSHLIKKNKVEFTRCVFSLCSSLVLFKPDVVADIKKVTDTLQALIDLHYEDETLKLEWQSFSQTKLQVKKNQENYFMSLNSEQTPNDFTKLSIIPNSEDIINNNAEEPFLQKNIIKGKLTIKSRSIIVFYLKFIKAIKKERFF